MLNIEVIWAADGARTMTTGMQQQKWHLIIIPCFNDAHSINRSFRMKYFLIATALALGAGIPPAFSADVGVSVTIGQPGFYGRIDIGDYPYPQPRVIYSQPRIVERVYIEREPIYLRVPPGHARNWPRFCHRYDACDRPVYFVQDRWYEQEYAPYYREYHRDRYNDHESAHRDDFHGNDGPGNNQHHGNNGHGKSQGHGHH
jgi:hypothetical protein